MRPCVYIRHFFYQISVKILVLGVVIVVAPMAVTFGVEEVTFIYSTIWSNLSKNFQFFWPYILVVAPMGVKVGM